MSARDSLIPFRCPAGGGDCDCAEPGTGICEIAPSCDCAEKVRSANDAVTFTAVVIAHADSPRGIVSNLLSQTRRPDEILIYVSDPTPEASEEIAALEDVPGVSIFLVPNLNDWGHEKCALGLARASSDYIGFFNSDDAYTLDYVEKMMAAAEAKSRPQIVYCDWVGRDRAPIGIDWKPRISTRGNWIGMVGLLRVAGYTGRDYEADGAFITRIRRLHPRIGRVAETLYNHN